MSYLYCQLLGKLNQQEIDAKLKDIITRDQDSWPTQFNLSETKLILRNNRDRLLILASPPKISQDESLLSLRQLDIEVEMRTIRDFLRHHYPPNHPQCPVKFYSDYFTQPICDLDVELLHQLLTPLSTYIIYSDVKAQVVTFRVSFWGNLKVEVDPFPILEWHWTEAKEKLSAAGERQLIIIIHQLLTANLADMYYLRLDPNYRPQFLYLKSELDLFGAAFNPYINLLQELQEQQLETYEEELVQLLPPPLPEFSFETVTVSQGGLNRRKGKAQYFTLDLGNGVTLDMVSIPGGEFLMGSPEDEEKRSRYEGPQHWVKVFFFFIGKYPVTQAQWEAVMGNNPSRWREPNLPVERVSWSDSAKFCYQLTQKTK